MSFGDESRCDVMNVGTMKIKMFDGVVCTLGDMACVPKMRLNLISLG